MRYRGYVALLAGLFALGAVVRSLWPAQRELIVHGKPVSAWAMALLGPAPTQPAQQVIMSFGSEAVPDLVRMLHSKDSVLGKPVHALDGALPPRMSARIQFFLALNEPARRREAAIMALGFMGTNALTAIPAFVLSLHDKNIAVRTKAAVNLGRIGPESLPGLMAALDDKALATRQAAMIGLSQLGFAAEPAVPKLVRLLEAPADRSRASSALQALGKPAVPALIRLLDHPSEEMRFEAIGLLGDIGGPARAAIPFLSKLIKDRSQTVRYRAVYSLGLICRSCEPVISLLRAALADESWDVRRTAANHLSQEPMVAQMTVDELLHEIERGTGVEKQRAIVNLGLIGVPAERAVPTLKKLAEAGSSKERELARESLLKIEAAAQKKGGPD